MNNVNLRLRYSEEDWKQLRQEAKRMKLPIKRYMQHKIMKHYGGNRECAPCDGLEIKKIEEQHQIDIPEYVLDRLKCKSSNTGLSVNILISLSINNVEIK